MSKRMRLSVGPPAGCRIFALPAGIFLAAILAFLVWVLIDQTPRFFAEGGLGAALGFIGFLILMGVALYAVGAMTWVYLRIGRAKVWLKGTVLIERRIVLRRRIDLRTARVELRRTTNANVAELSLVATDPRSGKSLDLLIQKGQETLPASELAVLAEAILGADSHTHRVGHDHSAAIVVADGLRELAAIDS